MFGVEDEPPGAASPPSFGAGSTIGQSPFPAADATAVRYGGFWRRFAAAIVDGFILWGVNLAASFLMRVSAGVPVGPLWKASAGATPLFTCVEGLVSLVIGWIYCAGLESSVKQATIGKMALGMRVTDLAGRRISFGRATGRHFSKILSTLILFIGFLMVAFSEKKQGLHDRIAETLV
ncbi:MAG: RDD family protein, partial [Thermoanaerobaculia bacterium]